MTALDFPMRRAAERRHSRRRLLLLFLLCLSPLPSVATTVISVSLFTERTFAPGDVATAPITNLEAGPSLVLHAERMLPGDSVSGELTIENTGDKALRYAAVGTATNRDGQALRALEARVGVAPAGCGSRWTELLYAGPLSQVRFGDPSTGGQRGDRVLERGGREQLCVLVELPLGAGDHHQAASTVIALSVLAEEVIDR